MLRCEHQAYYRGLACTSHLPRIGQCDFVGCERSCQYFERVGSSVYAYPSERIEQLVEEINLADMNSLKFLVDQLYWDIFEKEVGDAIKIRSNALGAKQSTGSPQSERFQLQSSPRPGIRNEKEP